MFEIQLSYLGLALQITILLLTLAITFPSFAKKENKIEITPFAGYRVGGDFDVTGDFYGEAPKKELEIDDSSSYGVILAWPYDNKRQGELVISHYESELIPASLLTPYTSDLAVTYVHLGGNVLLSRGIVPFGFSGGVGVTHFSPDQIDLDDETKLSVNICFHSQLDLTDRIAIRLGARVYATFLDSDSAIFCNEDVCNVTISSDMWLQSELSAGLTFTF